MKKKKSNHLNIFYSILIGVGLLFSACAHSEHEQTNKEAIDINQQKEEVTEFLNKQKTNIDDAIDDIKGQVGAQEPPLEQGMEELVEELEAQKRKIDDALDEVRSSTAENWKTVQKDSRELKNDVEQFLTQITS